RARGARLALRQALVLRRLALYLGVDLAAGLARRPNVQRDELGRQIAAVPRAPNAPRTGQRDLRQDRGRLREVPHPQPEVLAVLREDRGPALPCGTQHADARTARA